MLCTDWKMIFLHIQTSFTHSFIHMPSMEKINRIKTLLTIKVPEGITFVAGYFFLTMLVKLVLTTIVSHIGKTTSM